MPMRAVVWSTGGVGKIAIDAISRRPDMEIVGVWVHSPEKVGRDAGELAGIEPLGVTATNDADGLIASAPDAVVLDISLDGPDGLELLKILRARYPDLPVLVLSMHDESVYAERALRAGANGYVMKQEALESVIGAIREVLAGRPYLSNQMSAKLITNFASGSSQSNPTDTLSDRELEILDLIGKGRDVHEIAKALHISRKTVETHRAHIKEKLNLKNAREVNRFAAQWIEDQA